MNIFFKFTNKTNRMINYLQLRTFKRARDHLIIDSFSILCCRNCLSIHFFLLSCQWIAAIQHIQSDWQWKTHFKPKVITTTSYCHHFEKSTLNETKNSLLRRFEHIQRPKIHDMPHQIFNQWNKKVWVMKVPPIFPQKNSSSAKPLLLVHFPFNLTFSYAWHPPLYNSHTFTTFRKLYQ